MILNEYNEPLLAISVVDHLSISLYGTILATVLLG